MSRLINLSVILVLVAGSSLPIASASADSQTTRVCVSSKGVLRLPSKGKCRRSERPLTIVVAPASPGTQGETGATGAVGPAGPQGPMGPQGEPGSPDTGAEILAKLLAVDGTGSGLDADLLAGTPLSGLQRRGTTTACTTGSVVAGISASGDVTCVERAPMGAASGDLTGTYPGPRLAVQPAARLTYASSPTLVNGGATTVRWGGQDYEQGGDLYRGTLGSDCVSVPDACRLYAPKAGIYSISAGVAWSDGADTTKSRSLWLSRNGTRTLAQVQSPPVKDLFAWDQQIVSTHMKLAAGDYVTVHVESYHLDAATLESSQDRSFFALTWIGPVL